MHKIKAYIVLALFAFGLFGVFTVFPVQAAGPDWAGQGPEWYYDNLNSTQRKWIRQAIDYAIPREQIINGLHLGFAEAIATPIGVNFVGVYDPAVDARPYNPTAAGELLAKAFGKIYNEDVDENETHTATPYFKVTLVAPTTNTARTQWASLISFALNNIGIEAELKWWNWNVIMPRIFLQPQGIGLDYDHGGYDIFFVGYDASPDPDYRDQFDRASFPPSDNAYWIENDEIEALWDNILNEPDVNTRNGLLKDFQVWYKEQVPRSIIRQEIQLFGLDAELEGFESLEGIRNGIHNWTHPTQTSITVAQPGDFVDLNPALSNSYYDFLVVSNTHMTLARRRGEYNISHPVPYVAESWSPSADYLTWTVKIREGIKFEDGSDLTADDVVFTYQSAFEADLPHPGAGTLKNTLGNASNIVKTGPYEVEFRFPSFYPYVEGAIFGDDNYAILSKAQMSAIPYAEWKTDDTNTKFTPLGNGAYKFKSYDGTSTLVIEKNPYYNGTLMGHDPTMVGGGNFVDNPVFDEATFVVVKEATAAVAGLKSGQYDIIDSQMGIQAQAQEVNTSSWGTIVKSLEWGWQEMGFNHYNPIFGMNPHDPRELYPEDYAGPIDPLTIFFGLFVLAGIQIVRKRRRK
ncbi:MAG: ABC transporter substrate-binding protein [Candidatus Hodarchaeales archaeon]|jgi:ABC-type transport system substrate-binding protein